jgi:hypothetical protein
MAEMDKTGTIRPSKGQTFGEPISRAWGPTTIAQTDTDYSDRPAHRGHTVEVQGWNSEYVLLVIRSDDRVNEAIISPDDLMVLAEQAKAEAHRW